MGWFGLGGEIFGQVFMARSARHALELHEGYMRRLEEEHQRVLADIPASVERQQRFMAACHRPENIVTVTLTADDFLPARSERPDSWRRKAVEAALTGRW